MNPVSLRANVLMAYGANDSETEELLLYNQNQFNQISFASLPNFPPAPEPHVSIWQEYATEAETIGVYEALKPRLVQLQFPICAGISETEEYRAATRKGQPSDRASQTTQLSLQQPETLKLFIHQSLAGAIPVLVAGCREDFVTLVQAFTKRNEPHPIPDSMGACIIGGYNNWDRVQRYRQQWQQQNPLGDWNAEFKRLIPQKDLYQDRFILLSPTAYSGVAASDLGLTDAEWLPLSLTIRLEHECTHYFTRRFFGVMRNNLLDEFIADYRGIVAALGYYRADWFLNFMGLESYPAYRQGGRLENYRGEPNLSQGALKVLQALLKTAAENLERFERRYRERSRTLTEEVAVLIALAALTLEELASQSAESILEAAVSRQLDRARVSINKILHQDS